MLQEGRVPCGPDGEGYYLSPFVDAVVGVVVMFFFLNHSYLFLSVENGQRSKRVTRRESPFSTLDDGHGTTRPAGQSQKIGSVQPRPG